MNHSRPTRYGTTKTVADTQTTRAPVGPPDTVEAFLRALYYGLDEGCLAQRSGAIR